MNRISLSDSAGRAMSGMVRMTVNKINDNPFMQTMDFDGMNSDGRNKVERVQGYGFSSVPLPRDEGGAGGKGAGGQGEGTKGPAAEALAFFVGGQRNHPMILSVDDRRHRPMGMKPGENAQYDDLGQMNILRRTGAFMLSLDTAAQGSQQAQSRMVSMRHVEKQKQERKAASEKDQAQVDQQRQDYKHEGESVNTEVRCTKTKIEIMDGDTVVAVYDKSAKSWTFKAKNMITIECTDGPTNIKGKNINFNGGGSVVAPFSVQG